MFFYLFACTISEAVTKTHKYSKNLPFSSRKSQFWHWKYKFRGIMARSGSRNYVVSVLMFFSFDRAAQVWLLYKMFTQERYLCFCRDYSVRHKNLAKGRRPRTAVYTNFWLVEQCKHSCCDWSLALHFKIVSDMISLKYALVSRPSIHRLLEWVQFSWKNDRKKISSNEREIWCLPLPQ